jgi:hypothetical protein
VADDGQRNVHARHTIFHLVLPTLPANLNRSERKLAPILLRTNDTSGSAPTRLTITAPESLCACMRLELFRPCGALTYVVHHSSGFAAKDGRHMEQVPEGLLVFGVVQDADLKQHKASR